ncbi:MAG: Hpt domain-containing protein, partial [Bdellovibrionales bacterium]|nr:Hpt domain-containing protein [Bdellovibrionales bacterium]
MFDDLIGQYVVEGLENLDKWEEACLELGRGFDEPSSRLLYRIAHNLKGGAQIFGLEELIQFCHRMEDLLRLVMNRDLEVDQELVAFLLDLETLLRNWLNQLGQDMAFVPSLAAHKNRLEIFIDRSKESPTSASDGSLPCPQEGSNPPELEDHLREMLASESDPQADTEGVKGHRSGTPKPGGRNRVGPKSE